LVELMGGRIWGERGVAIGSVISFVVPYAICAKLEVPVVKQIEPDHGETPMAPLRILLVEDSADNCIITQAYLELTPCNIEIADNGAIACEMFKAGDYDLILMDRQMPVMDGLTATREIRAWEQAKGRSPVPIIALTAYALKGEREVCIAAGCTDFLTKPIKQEVLLQAIREHSKDAKVKIHEPETVLLRALADRVPVYLQKVQKDTDALLDALDKADFKTVETLAHQMVGSGASYGFQTITDICAGLEQNARDANSDASRKWVGELSGYLNRVEVKSRMASRVTATNGDSTVIDAAC